MSYILQERIEEYASVILENLRYHTETMVLWYLAQ